MPVSEGEFKIRDVGRILDLLVHELYGSDPYLTIRELVQNAHDALVEFPGGPRAVNTVIIRLNGLDEHPYLEVEDRGIGMSREDIETKLCVVGDTSKLESANLRDLIGKYGIGFLSVFIVADHVEVLTRTDGAPTSLLWETKDKQKWTLTDAPQSSFDHGTRVRLYFRASYDHPLQQRIKDLQHPKGIGDVVRQHCYLIPYPIRVEDVNAPGAGTQVNAQQPPWESEHEAREAFTAVFGSRSEPLFMHRFNVSEAGRRASGVLYFRGEIFSSLSAILHVKRIFVDAEVNKLLPPYAPFVQAIVECPDLELDLARRQVQVFDSAYRWLRRVIADEFRKAFVKFAEHRAEGLFELWPRIDRTVISRLIRELNVEDDGAEARELAEKFLIEVAKYIPFYAVNLVTGTQGRAALRTIKELISAPGATRQGDKVIVYYTDSANPVEKDMLLNTYPEIIDVGRAQREADLALLTQMAMYNEKFGDFELRLVQASRFEPVEREDEWRQLIKWVQDGLNFYSRSHDVHVERFLPKGTPVVITDTKVDSEMVEKMRRELEQGVAVNPNAQGVISKMLKVLDDLGSPGGVLTIHINADNPLIDRLRSATHREAARLGMMSVCWRAVLDYFGWNSDRDMLNRDKQLTQELIIGLLEITDERDQIDAHARTLRQELDQLQASLDWGTEGRREAIVGVLDIEDSVARIVSNPGGGPDDAFAYLQLVLSDVREYIEGFARVVGLTGDGMQFVIEQGGRSGDANVRAALTTGLAARLQTVSDRNAKVRSLREMAGYQVPRFRTALAAGPVYISKMAPSHVDVLGLPAVHASRLCAQKNLYNDADTSLLLTQQAINAGPVWGLWQAEGFAPAGETMLDGIAAPIPIYKPSPQ